MPGRRYPIGIGRQRPLIGGSAFAKLGCQAYPERCSREPLRTTATSPDIIWPAAVDPFQSACEQIRLLLMPSRVFWPVACGALCGCGVHARDLNSVSLRTDR